VYFEGSPSEEEPRAETTRGDSYILICSHIPMEERKREADYTPRGSLTRGFTRGSRAPLGGCPSRELTSIGLSPTT